MSLTPVPGDAKATLQRYLQEARDAIVWKTDGLSERNLRLPRTPTGTNLLGLVKHCATVEIGYLGPTFGRPWPRPEQVPWFATWFDDDVPDDDPQADLYATESESAAELLELYRQVWEFADRTIAELPLDAPGHVPWWGENGAVDLHTVLVHLVAELQRHAGHADVVREGIDGAVGLSPRNGNVWTAPDDRAAYVAKLTRIADSVR
ncbi:DinB family protein [Cellulomonas sp. APG4]|uniref:DinB family protein n=1 Tax=Cellulomonas sp. APG4 TaxID=1538656 RepID=UPI00137AC043|nr:DinB family protein [Cellulomonas sp. APG4]NCT92091.1 DinB family protein [Cellulomonas sp. APG4]